MNNTQLIEEGTKFVGNLKLKDAEECFSKVLSMDPRSTDAIIWLGRIALIQGENEKGDRLLDQVISLNPSDTQALTLRGVSELEKGKSANAIDYLLKAININPELQIYGHLARCYSLSGKRIEAQQAAQKALQMNPHDTLAHYELACILADQGKTTDALSHLVDSINSNPLFVKGYFALGTILTMAKKAKAAIDIYRIGLENVPDAHVLRERLCEVLAVENRMEEAIVEANECIRRRNSYADHLRLGLYSIIVGEFEVAEKAFLKSLELNSENWEAHYNLGELYSAANLFDEARVQFESALSKGKEEWKAQNAMGVWMLRSGKNPKDAESYFKKANELDATRPEPVMNLALVYASLHDWDTAKSYCTQLRRTVPAGSKYFTEAERLFEAINSEIGQ